MMRVVAGCGRAGPDGGGPAPSDEAREATLDARWRGPVQRFISYGVAAIGQT